MSSNRLDYDVKAYEKTINESVGPGYYQLSKPPIGCKPCFNNNPEIRLQHSGNSIAKDKLLIDVDSELMGLTRKLSSDPNTHYKPSEEMIIKHLNLEDGFFHQESTLLNNPPSLLRGQVKNRWDDIPKDPLKNILEPFNRLGEDTYLSTMDDDGSEENCNN